MLNMFKQVMCAAVFSSSWAGAGDCDWAPLGTGVGPAAYATAVLTDGQAVYGGSISLAGSLEVDFITQWDGASWQPIGGGVNGFVRTILAMPDGGFVAGGQFTHAGGMPASLVARWDGTQWSAFGQGLDAGSCRDLLWTSTNKLIASGTFLQADGLPAWGIARWDGSVWTKMGNRSLGGGFSGHFGSGNTPTFVLCLAEMPNGDIIAGGNFTHADNLSSPGIARWNGLSWSPLGSGTTGTVRAMTVLPDGRLLVAGLFGSAGGVPCNGLAIWDGSSWSAMGDGLNGVSNSSPFALETTAQGMVVMSGAFDMVDSVPVNNIAILDPSTGEWSALGSGMIPSFQTSVFDVAVDPHGVIYAGGQFASAGGHNDAWNATVFDCGAGCPADLTGEGDLDFFDVSVFLNAFAASDQIADFVDDDILDFFDVQSFLQAFAAGCP